MTVSWKKIIERQRNRGSIKDTNLFKNLTEWTTTSDTPDIETPNTESLNTLNIQSDTPKVTDILKQQQLTANQNNQTIQAIQNINKPSQSFMTEWVAPTQEEQQQKLNELMMKQKVEASQYEAEQRGTWSNVVNHPNLDPNAQWRELALETIKWWVEFIADKTKRILWYETDQALTFAKNELQTQYINAKSLTEQSEVAEQQRNNVFKTQDDQYWPFAQPQISPEVAENIAKHPNKWLNNEWTEMYMSNGQTTISKPIIKIKTYSETLQDLYNDITYEFAQNGNVYSVDQIREAYPEFYDQSDKIIGNFIEDCLYDVQQGKRRPIESYIEHYAWMSKSDGYLHQQDALITALTNEDNIATSIWMFANWTLELPGRTADEVTKYIQSIYTIQNIVDQYNKAWYNETNAWTYIMAKTFADKNPLLKQALDYYDNFKLTTQEATIFATQYKKTKEDLKDITSSFEWMTMSEYTREIMDSRNEYINYIKSVVDNEINKNRSESRWLSSDYSPLWAMLNLLEWKYYEDDGKIYDMKGNEIQPDETWGWILTKFANAYMQQAENLETLTSDIEVLEEQQNIENIVNIWSDLINSTFDAMMNQSLWWLWLQSLWTMWAMWHCIESFFMKWITWFWSLVWWLANVTWATDWRSEKSKEKLKQAAWWLLFAWIMKNKKIQAFKRMVDKQVIWWIYEWLKWLDESVIKKSVDAYTSELMKGVEVVEVMELKDNIRETTTPKLEWKVGEPTKDTTKMSQEEVEQLQSKKTTRRFNINRQTLQNAKNAFRKTFEEEYSKKLQSEWYKPTIVDTLYNSILNTRWELKKENYETTKSEIKKNKEKETKEVKEVEQVEQDITTTPDVIEAKDIVEEPTAEKVEKVEQVEQTRADSLKSTLKWMLQLMKDYVNNRSEKKRETKLKKEKEKLGETLREEWFTNEEIDLINNSPYSDIILDIVNTATKEEKTSKWKIKEVQVESEKSTDEIQREVLSQWFMKIQQYIDRLVEEKKQIGELYENLSQKKTINTRWFKHSEEFQKLLDDFWLEYTEKYNFDTWKTEPKIKRKWGGETTSNQEAMINYLYKILNLIWERTISEQDAQAIRTKFKFKDDTIGDYVWTFEKLLRWAFNQFLDKQSWAKWLREIDKQYSDVLEQLSVFDELTSKDENIKQSAKNKVLKRSETELDMMNDLIPGIKELVELARKSPELVKKSLKLKLKQKDTRRWLADPIRYFFVSAPAVWWFAAWWLWGALIWSFFFKWSNMLWNKIKSKIVWKAPDLKLWNELVDNLKIGDNEKTKLKEQLLNNIEELRKQKFDKRKTDFDKIMTELNEMMIDRSAKEIQEKREMEKQKEEQRKQKEKEVEKNKERIEKEKEQLNQDTTKQEQLIEEPKEQKQEIKEEPKEEQSMEDFVAETNEQSPKQEWWLRYEEMSDEVLYKLREDPNCPEEIKTQIENIVNSRYEKWVLRETQKWETESQAWVKDEVEFVRRAHQLQEMEKNLWKVGKNKVKDSEKRKNMEMEFLRKKEAFIEEIKETYWIDQHEAYDKFLEFENRWIEEEQYINRWWTKNRNDYDKEHKQEIKSLQEQWKKDKENQILEASAGKEEWKEYSPEVIEAFEKLEDLSNTLKEIEEEIALEKLEEEWKEITQKSLEDKKEELKESDTTWIEALDKIMGKDVAIESKIENFKEDIKTKSKKNKVKEKTTQIETKVNETKPENKPIKEQKEKKEKYVSEKTSTYEWKWKENIEKFNEEFKDDPNLYEEDEYGENVWTSKEAKLHNHVFKTFNKVETSDSPMTNDRYNEQVTKATSIYNTNISYKDINLKYYTTELNYQKGTWAPKEAKAQFDRNDVEISIWDKKNRYTVIHEITHALDYKFAKELWYDWTIPLSEIVMQEWFTSDNPLIQRYKKLIESIDNGDPAESFAQFWEQFGEWTEWRKPKSNANIKRYIDWLSDMADAREKWELKDGTLEKTEWVDINYYKHFKTWIVDKTEAPQLKSEIERLYETYKEQRFPDNEASEVKMIEKMNSLVPKGVPYNSLTKTQQHFYDIKDQ